jgi:hypothetical protein
MLIALAPVEDGPSELLPTTPAVPKLHILPPSLIWSPEGAIQTSHVIRDVLVELATTDVAYLDLFTHLKDLLIEETAVHSDNDGHIGPIVLANPGYYVSDHLLCGIGVIGMGVSPWSGGFCGKVIYGYLSPIGLRGFDCMFFGAKATIP